MPSVCLTDEQNEQLGHELFAAAGFGIGSPLFALRDPEFGIERFAFALVNELEREVPLTFEQIVSCQGRRQRYRWRLDVIPDLIERFSLTPRPELIPSGHIWESENWRVRGQFGKMVDPEVQRDVVRVQVLFPDPMQFGDGHLRHGMMQIVRGRNKHYPRPSDPTRDRNWDEDL